MAGIGFRLQQLRARGTYTHSALAYASTAMIVAGPWLATVASLALLGLTTRAHLDGDGMTLMYATITYVFMASLLLTGGPQMAITRYLADRIYVKDVEAVGPTAAGVILGGSPALFALSLPFLALAPFDFRYRLLVASLFLTASLIWLAMTFLSAARDYTHIVLAFVIGYAVGLGCAAWLVRTEGATGALTGFALGEVVCLSLLLEQIFREFPAGSRVDLAFLRYFRRFRDLLLIGFLYNAGVWADKVIGWFSENGQVVADFYRVFPTYDYAMLVGYLSSVPASVVFFIHVETSFHRHYRQFYTRIGDRASLDDITEAKRGMSQAARSGLVAILKVQTVVVLGTLLFAPQLADLVGLSSADAGLLRVTVLAGNTQFLVLAALVLLLYLDQRRVALTVMLVFFLTNVGLTLAFLRLTPDLLGLGYLAATVLGALLAMGYLRSRLEKLDYIVFMLQPAVPAGR